VPVFLTSMQNLSSLDLAGNAFEGVYQPGSALFRPLPFSRPGRQPEETYSLPPSLASAPAVLFAVTGPIRVPSPSHPRTARPHAVTPTPLLSCQRYCPQVCRPCYPPPFPASAPVPSPPLAPPPPAPPSLPPPSPPAQSPPAGRRGRRLPRCPRSPAFLVLRSWHLKKTRGPWGDMMTSMTDTETSGG